MKKNRLERLCEAIETSVEESCKEPVTVAFSGGIDSSLVAFLANKFTDVELIAVGTPNSYDLEAAVSAAKMIDMKLRTIIIEPSEMVLEGFNMQKELKLSPIEIEFMLPFWIATKNSTNPILMCGQGADELFGGYARFRKKNAKNNLTKEVKDLINRLPDREKKITDLFNRNLSCPYLSKDVIKAAEKFTIKERIGKVGKVPLREAASKLKLPEDIVNRKKKAAQYGSGSQKAIKDIIKHKIEFGIEFDNKKIAESIAKATEPENAGWVETVVKDNVIKATVKAENLGSLREAAEDFMACLSVAEKVSKQE
jgi:asparagine synthase (glutamine-hydrolysing)